MQLCICEKANLLLGGWHRRQRRRQHPARCAAHLLHKLLQAAGLRKIEGQLLVGAVIPQHRARRVKAEEVEDARRRQAAAARLRHQQAALRGPLAALLHAWRPSLRPCRHWGPPQGPWNGSSRA